MFAWELGANYGHLSRDLPVAQYLRSQGHDVSFVIRDARVAAERLLPAGFRFVTAPLALGFGPPRDPAGNYAEILLGAGYGDELTLVGLVHAWEALMNLERPDVIVVDHAPTALVAAHALGLPAVQLGTGFFVPPAVTPLPSIRPWESISVARLRSSEALVLDRINAILSKHGRPPLAAVADLFNSHRSILATLSELDHYGDRAGAQYIGPIFDEPGTQAVHWQADARRRLFAYLRPSVPGVELLLDVLAQCADQVICAMPGATDAQFERFGATGIQLIARTVPLQPLLGSADLVVSYGGPGTLAAALLAGVPMLLVPQMVEQYLCCLRVQQLGAGVLMGFERTRQGFQAALQRVLLDTRYRDTARGIAAKYRDFDSHVAVRDAAAVIAAAAS